MAIQLSDEQVRRLRIRAQGLVEPAAAGADAAVEVARRVVGLQAQDIFAATLGVRVRSAGATLADVDRARFETRRVVWTWAMRGTLHLLDTEDLDWLMPIVAPVLIAAGRRRRAELGIDEESYERGARAVRDRLAGAGPSTREELSAALAAAGLKADYSVTRHILYRAALEGLVCMGPDRGAKPTYVLTADWLGRQPWRVENPEPLPAGIGVLAGRYLDAYAPAAPADLAAWSGLPATLVRPAWEAVAADLVEVTVAGKPSFLPRGRLAELDLPGPDAHPAGTLPPAATHAATPDVRLLPAFDTYLLGYRSRDLALDPSHALRVNGGGGMIRPVVLVDGRVAGTWRTNRKGRQVNIVVDAFEELSPEVQAGIAAETAAIDRFLAP